MTEHPSDGAGNDGDEADMPSDRSQIVRLLGAMADPRRRAILAALADRTAPCPFEELAAALARRTDRDARRALIRIYHHEIPVLARLGLVDVDWGAREVTPTPLARALGERIAESGENEEPR